MIVSKEIDLGNDNKDVQDIMCVLFALPSRWKGATPVCHATVAQQESGVMKVMTVIGATPISRLLKSGGHGDEHL